MHTEVHILFIWYLTYFLKLLAKNTLMRLVAAVYWSFDATTRSDKGRRPKQSLRPGPHRNVMRTYTPNKPETLANGGSDLESDLQRRLRQCLVFLLMWLRWCDDVIVFTRKGHFHCPHGNNVTRTFFRWPVFKKVLLLLLTNGCNSNTFDRFHRKMLLRRREISVITFPSRTKWLGPAACFATGSPEVGAAWPRGHLVTRKNPHFLSAAFQFPSAPSSCCSSSSIYSHHWASRGLADLQKKKKNSVVKKWDFYIYFSFTNIQQLTCCHLLG